MPVNINGRPRLSLVSPDPQRELLRFGDRLFREPAKRVIQSRSSTSTMAEVFSLRVSLADDFVVMNGKIVTNMDSALRLQHTRNMLHCTLY